MLRLVDQEINYDLIWWRNEKVRSEPDWSDRRLGFQDKYACCDYLRIVMSFLTNDYGNGPRREMHQVFCGGCGKSLCASLPHKISQDTVCDFTLYFGKHKGKKLSEVPVDYLKWCLENLKDDKVKKRIEVFLK